jgi:hypothetical protein
MENDYWERIFHTFDQKKKKKKKEMDDPINEKIGRLPNNRLKPN